MEGVATPARVLIVGRDLEARRRVEQALATGTSPRFSAEAVPDVTAALERLPSGGVDVALVRLQPTEGLSAVERIHRAVPEVPIVAVLATGDERAAQAAFAAGALDFVTDDHLDGEVLRRTLRYAIDRRRLEGEIHRRAVLDETTGVYNARGFEQLGAHHLRMADRSKEPVVLVFVRLEEDPEPAADESADEPAVEAAEVLREAVREADVIARLGPDTFGVLLAGNAAGAEAIVLSRIVEAVATRNARVGRTGRLALSLGSAEYDPRHPSTLAALIRAADARMQRR